MSADSYSTEMEIKAMAKRLGFSLCGITTMGTTDGYPTYLEWLGKGYHAGMSWLDTPYHREMRQDPLNLFPNLRSIIVLGLSYSLPSMDQLDQHGTFRISGYAAGDDYHGRIPRLVEPLMAFLTYRSGSTTMPRVYIDSAPILERELAVRAGMGWIGKNSCLISPVVGSGVLLAEIFTDIPLAADLPFNMDRCGTCTRCVDACPTRCILPNRTIDANRCLSYQSIENKGIIPFKIREKFGGQVFGCDICQAVCPWNDRFNDHEIDPLFLSVQEVLDLLTLDGEDFEKRFKNSALSRARRSGIIRNLLIGLGNARVKEARTAIEKILQTEVDPIILDAAQWALDCFE